MKKNHNEKPNREEFFVGDFVVTNEFHSYEGRKYFGRDLQKVLKPSKIIKKIAIPHNNFCYELENGKLINGSFLERSNNNG